ncbi:GntR family transcriptional regulator [Lacimicrobium alkaliphilum]|uniref:GntR family transcriptional regulator n=1 Tax=Lacimicrobium alkaliphilum TaxID=1526571 RepID=A0A0U3B5Y0_9ALTE|nr:GntR family transcriptional regulator [Lacimicrobium alkaliphilum]ALT00529.1 GntR family transcriptional regulator [Lacimicrobium alkaliphilum]
MAIEHKTRTQLVTEAIREKIVSGQIKAGEPLRQAALAEEMRVSRIPVREALMQLEAEGLVNLEAHKGATAAEISIEQIDELFELRAMLEAELLKYSVRGLTEQDFEDAEGILAALEAATEDGDSNNITGRLNSQFHQKLYSRANRPQTEEFVRMLSQNSERYTRMYIIREGEIVTSSEQHRQLLELCKAGDSKLACDYLRQHILQAMEDIKAMLKKAM